MKKLTWLPDYPYQDDIIVDSVTRYSHGTLLQEDNPISVRTTL
jgi:hypothetical protein